MRCPKRSLTRYFKSLDSEKLYFVQGDIDQFAPMRSKLDDAINNEDLTLPFQIYNLYQQRFNGPHGLCARAAEGASFDFTSDETRADRPRKGPEWAKSDEEKRAICGASASRTTGCA